MDVRQLEYFLAVVDHGGFNRAATALYLSQPSLSQSIRSLERDLGSELFHRIGRRVVLTDAGTALIEPARTAVRSLEFARASVESVHGLRGGRVEIAVMPSQSISPLAGMIRRFGADHPEVSVTMRAAFTPRDVTEMVRTGAAELGLLAAPEPVSHPRLRVYPLCAQRFVLLTRSDGPFPPGSVVRNEELAGHRLVVGQQGTGLRTYVDALRARGMEVTVAVETEHRVSILPLVLEGVGLAVVTDAWRDLAERAGALVLDLEPRTLLHVALVSRPSGLTPAARAFVDRAVGDATAAAADGPDDGGPTDRQPLSGT